MQLLKNDIVNFAKRHGLQKSLKAAAVVKAAQGVILEILPEVLRNEVVVGSFNEGILIIKAPSGVALANLDQYRTPLLNGLKKRLGKAVVEQLKIQAKD